jgi:hypothetical protein
VVGEQVAGFGVEVDQAAVGGEVLGAEDLPGLAD